MKKTIKKGIALLAVTAIGLGCAAGFLPTVTANAGKSDQKVVTEEMYKDELSNQKWYLTRDIAHEDGKIVFKKSATNAESKIVSVVLANDLREMGIETCVNGSLTVKVTEALDGEFYIGFGLERPYSNVNSASAICLYDNGGAIGVKVKNFAGEGAGVVCTSTATYAYGDEIVIDFEVLSAGSMYLSVNDETVLNYDNEKLVATNGYFGFGQSAASSVEIYDAAGKMLSRFRPVDVPLVRSRLTTVKAAFLTSEAGGGVSVSPDYEGNHTIVIK